MRYVIMGIALLWCTAAPGETYFVSENGDDSWPGTSADSAFATLQHAADLVVPGDSVLCLDGFYAGFDLRQGGEETQPIVFSTTGSNACIDQENPITPDGINLEGADWVTVEGYNLSGLPRNGIRVVLSDHVTVRNCICENCYERGIFTGFADWMTIEENVCSGSVDEHGIYHSNSGDHPVIRFNQCHHNSGCGIHMNGDLSAGGDGIISDAVVEGNVIYENGTSGGSGINCDGVVESVIFNNLIYMNHSSGISLYMIDGASGSHHVEVYNNTVVQAADGRWGININSGSTHATLLNNIVLSAHSWRGSVSIDASSQTGFQSDNNLLEDRMSADGGSTVITLAQWQSLGWDPESEVCADWDSTFLDWYSGDFHYMAGSQAVDSGTDQVQATVTEDLDGVPRPQGAFYDTGCYEMWPLGLDPQGDGGGGVSVTGASGLYLFRGIPDDSSIEVYDLTGRSVASPERSAGTAFWNTAGHPAGVYLFAVLREGYVLESGKLVNY